MIRHGGGSSVDVANNSRSPRQPNRPEQYRPPNAPRSASRLRRPKLATDRRVHQLDHLQKCDRRVRVTNVLARTDMKMSPATMLEFVAHVVVVTPHEFRTTVQVESIKAS